MSMNFTKREGAFQPAGTSPDGYVGFGATVVHGEQGTGGQTQYISRHIDGRHGSADLGEGLRFIDASPGDYHAILIHQDDVAEFRRRVIAHRQEFRR